MGKEVFNNLQALQDNQGNQNTLPREETRKKACGSHAPRVYRG